MNALQGNMSKDFISFYLLQNSCLTPEIFCVDKDVLPMPLTCLFSYLYIFKGPRPHRLSSFEGVRVFVYFSLSPGVKPHLVLSGQFPIWPLGGLWDAVDTADLNMQMILCFWLDPRFSIELLPHQDDLNRAYLNLLGLPLVESLLPLCHSFNFWSWWR